MKIIELQGALTAPCGYKWYSNGKSRFNKNYKHYLIKESKIMMTREEKLWTMTGTILLGVAERLGIKTSKSTLKQGKEKLIAKILEAENAKEQEKKDLKAVKKETKDLWEKEADEEKAARDQKQAENDKAAEEEFNKKHPVASTSPIKAPESLKANKTTKEPKKANLKLSELTYKGETKSIRMWAEELNMPWATLYDRVNRNGWPIDLAIETPLGQRRPKKA